MLLGKHIYGWNPPSLSLIHYPLQSRDMQCEKTFSYVWVSIYLFNPTSDICSWYWTSTVQWLIKIINHQRINNSMQAQLTAWLWASMGICVVNGSEYTLDVPRWLEPLANTPPNRISSPVYMSISGGIRLISGATQACSSTGIQKNVMVIIHIEWVLFSFVKQ